MTVEIHDDATLAGSDTLAAVFGDALPKLEVFHGKLKEEGEPRGLIGPRDVDILWERHLLNSAALAPFVRRATAGAQFKSVADLGSGGGFPGLVLAAMLPDRAFTLIEPMERRVEWLAECVEAMNLENVQIVRARAEEAIAALDQARAARGQGPSNGRGAKGARGRNARGARNGDAASKVAVPEAVRKAIRHPFTVVTCRAVAPMTKLAGWTLPLVAPGGELIALKGRSAQAEIDKAHKVIEQYGGIHPRVEEAPVADGLGPTHVVIVDKRR
ncbi:MAG: 16S rRNA (guanine(527)-N(7))-methyltransferase RsmG [Bifidobacterium sp.]|nr:16S rRNA (guanine(527)-N(7))-methyltransferase RsmG [Bifidobacterium sp.]